jgi:hypothetical protein
MNDVIATSHDLKDSSPSFSLRCLKQGVRIDGKKESNEKGCKENDG